MQELVSSALSEGVAMVNLCDFLKAKRMEQGMTQTQLAKDANLSRAVVSQLELYPERWNTVSEPNLRALALALGMDEDQLVELRRAQLFRSKPADMAGGYFRDEDAGTSVGMGVKMPLKIDVTQPLTDKEGKPADWHTGEDPNQKGLCFLEGLRKTYLAWEDEDPDARTDLSLFRAITDNRDGPLVLWARRHQIPVGADVAYIRPGQVLYEYRDYDFVPASKPLKKSDLAGAQLVTVGVRRFPIERDGQEIGAEQWDHVRLVRDNDIVLDGWVPCRHLAVVPLEASMHEWEPLLPDGDDSNAVPVTTGSRNKSQNPFWKL